MKTDYLQLKPLVECFNFELQKARQEEKPFAEELVKQLKQEQVR